MTTEVGVPGKTIHYINCHLEGKQNGDTISFDNRWAEPQLQKQSDYLVAISRFEVPMNRVAVTAQMDNCIEIFAYNETINDIEEGDEKEPDDQLNGRLVSVPV